MSPAPNVRVFFVDGQLGQGSPSIAKLVCRMGVCLGGAPNVLQAFTDATPAQQALLGGPLLEGVLDSLAAGAGEVFAMPLTPSVAGGFGSVTHGGPGTGTVTVSAAPLVPVDLKIQTGGALGTMTFSWRLNGGAYSTPVATVGGGPFAFAVPGTLTTVTFADQVYTTAAVWTVSILGAITLSGTGTVGWVTQVSSPVDNFDVRVAVTTAGALGTAVVTTSVDGNNNTVAGILTPSGGKYAVPNTGVVLTFSGTFTAGDTYQTQATTAGFGNSDVAAAFVAFRAQVLDVEGFHVMGQGANAAAAASLAATVDAQLAAMEGEFRYAYAVIEVAMTEADSAINTAFQNFVSTRVIACATDIAHQSASATARVIRRSAAIAVVSRASVLRPGKKLSWVRPGALPRVLSIYPNGGGATSWTPDVLAANRFLVLRNLAGRAGYLVYTDNTMAGPGSDYAKLVGRRVADAAARRGREALLDFIDEDLFVTSDGKLDPREARRVEKAVRVAVADEVLSGATDGNADASDVRVTVDTSSNIISTAILPVTIGVRPKGYASFINVTVGLVNPNLQTAA